MTNVNRLTMCASLTALAVVLRLPTFVTRLFDPDEAAIGVQAMVVRAGGTLYRDIYDRKPPLPPLLYAASFAATDSTDVRPLRVLVTLLLAASGIVIAMDCWRRWGVTAAWWGGVLTIAGAMALFPADAGAANYAHFALLPGAAAIVLARRGNLVTAIAAGVAIGLAILTRQSWLLGVVPGCISVGLCGRWRNVVPFLGAAALTVATTGLYAPLGSFWEWNVTNSPGFVFAGADIWTAIVHGLASVAGFALFHPVVVVAVFIAAGAAITAMRRRTVPSDLDLWLWAASGIAAWGAGVRFFGHYWLQALPPLVLLAVPIVSRWTGRARSWAVAGVVIPGVVAWVLLFVPGSFHHRPDTTNLASYVKAHSAAGDRVFVWGSYPEILVASDRLPAGSLVHTDFVVGRSGGRNDPAQTLKNAVPGALDTMMASLQAHPPALVLDTSTAKDLGYENFPTSVIPEVDQFVRANYHQVATVDGVTVWQRNAPG